MNQERVSPVGLVLGSHMPPEFVGPTARLAEECGFGELWFSEDCFFSGGASGATAALHATETIPVGLGIVSAMARHPAITAMEFAAISRMFPGRFTPGIGYGVPAWLDQMGVSQASPLTALRECVTSLRRLLDGEELTENGRVFSFDRVKLTYPPPGYVPIMMGMVNEKGLRLAGEIADGSVLSVLASPAYVSWAREQIREGQQHRAESSHHRIVTYTLFSVDPDGDKARAAVRDATAFYLAAMPDTALSRVYGIQQDLDTLLARADVGELSRSMPNRWIDDLAVAGDPDECAEKLRALIDAGSDSVGLWLFPVDEGERIARLAASEVLNRL
jgi:5,10-methylenetetrahydromethanopterin reductase